MVKENQIDLENRIVEARNRTEPLGVGRATADGRVSRDTNPVFLTELHEALTLKVWVCFYLVDGRLDFRVSQAVPGQKYVVVAAKNILLKNLRT